MSGINLLHLGSDVVGNGWGDGTTSEPLHPHDLIEFTFPGRRRISEKAKRLYGKGHSVSEVSALTGLPATSLYEALKAQKLVRRLANARKTNPPYGYGWLDGALVKNPTEYKAVQVILSLNESGRRPHQIAKHLNASAMRPRRGKVWYARTVTDIIARDAERP